VSPDFQAHESNPNVKRPVELKRHKKPPPLSTPCGIIRPLPAQSTDTVFLFYPGAKGRREQVLFMISRRETETLREMDDTLVAELMYLYLEKTELEEKKKNWRERGGGMSIKRLFDGSSLEATKPMT
jgi:hypothetical protein